MLLLIITKPNFLYDHDKSKFREFGSTKDKTICSIGSIAIIMAFAISILFIFLTPKTDKVKSVQQIAPTTVPIQYIQVPMPVQSMPQIIYTQPVPQVQSVSA